MNISVPTFVQITIGALLLIAPLRARDINVPSGGDVQAAIDAAIPGDTITLAAGGRFSGAFRLPYKAAAANGELVTIRSSAFARFQDGIRVSPANRSDMALIVASPGLSAFQTDRGANHYRLSGLEITSASGTYAFDLIRIGLGDESTNNTIPEYFQLDHLYVHGDPAAGSKRGIAANGKSITIRDSYVSGFFNNEQDTQAICGWNGPGPISIVNNYLEASGENIMFGGAPPALSGVVPSDITIRNNYLLKPVAWKTKDYAIKNLLELKNARRVLIEGNVLENSWGTLQQGHALMFSVRTEGGAASWAAVQDVTVRYNIVRNVNRLLTFVGFDDVIGRGVGMNLTVQNNLFEHIGERGFSLFGARNPVIDHNTLLLDSSGTMVVIADLVPTQGFVFTNNITSHGPYGVFGSGAGVGMTALNSFFPGYRFTNNVLFDSPVGPTYYPAQNWFPTLAGVGFVNPSSGDYRLSSSSAFLKSGTDGSALGADMTTVLSMTANAVSGATLAAPAYSLTPSTTSIAAGASLAVTWRASGAAKTDRIGLYPVGSGPSAYVWMSGQTNAEAAGTFSLPAPVVVGQYEFRYLPGGGLTAANTSAAISVTAPPQALLPAPPGLSTAYIFPAVPKPGQNFTVWLYGIGFDISKVQIVVTGPACPSGCTLSPSYKAATLLSGTVMVATKGNYTIAARNGASGVLSVAKPFVVQ